MFGPGHLLAAVHTAGVALSTAPAQPPTDSKGINLLGLQLREAAITRGVMQAVLETKSSAVSRASP